MSQLENSEISVNSNIINVHLQVDENEASLLYNAFVNDDLSSIKYFIVNQDREVKIMGLIIYIFTVTENGVERLIEGPEFIYKIIGWVKEYVDIYYRHEYSPGEMLSIDKIKNNDYILDSLNETNRLSDKQKLFISNKLDSDSKLAEMYDLTIKITQIERTLSVANHFLYLYENNILSDVLFDDEFLSESIKILKLIITQCNEEIFEPIYIGQHGISDRIIEILRSISTQEGLDHGWDNISDFKSDLKSIIIWTRWFLYKQDIRNHNSIDYFRKIVNEIGDYVRRENESQEVFTQLLSESSNDKKQQKKKIVKNKVRPVSVKHNKSGRDDNPELELVTTVDLLHKNTDIINNTNRKYKIAKRVRRWIINDISKPFTDLSCCLFEI